MRYYHSGVLAMFLSQSEKYSIQTDEFEGSVRIRDSCPDGAYLSVDFGFRECRNGEWPSRHTAPI